jgi:hypothetical protein
MKSHRESLSEAERTSWLVVIVLFTLIVIAGCLFWAKVSAYGP